MVWQSLHILDTEAGRESDDKGVVVFRAVALHDEQELTLQERSRFVKEDGKWFYVDGDIMEVPPTIAKKPKVGRNEPCPCGSGKKFKKCCGP